MRFYLLLPSLLCLVSIQASKVWVIDETCASIEAELDAAMHSDRNLAKHGYNALEGSLDKNGQFRLLDKNAQTYADILFGKPKSYHRFRGQY